MGRQIFMFIVLVRAIAAIVITNSHYTGVYPTDLIANGGLLGDVLFFAVSGYCLSNIKDAFPKWYLKRFIRVYIPVWIITLIYVLLGFYWISNPSEGLKMLLWPTHWHFIASIILLYIPFYIVSKNVEMNTKNYQRTISVTFALQLILYLTIYDHSYYHIDSVYQPMIEFLFFQSMVLGLHFRWRCTQNDCLNTKASAKVIMGGGILFVLYFISKTMFVKYESIADFQILNQIVLYCFLYVLFLLFMGLEKKLQKFKGTKCWSVIKFIADRTLEIYLVQYVILEYLKIGVFPINWLLLTSCIIAAATILRWLSRQIITRINI